MEIICGIYKITSPTGKIYIGQSKDIYKRWNYYYKKLKCQKQIYLYRSLIKHGAENHKFEIVVKCSIERLDKFEIGYIRIFDTFNTKHGLNLMSGGQAGKLSDESIKKRTQTRKLNGTDKCSEETKLKISNTLMGNIPWSKGKKFTDEHRKRIGDNNWMKGKPSIMKGKHHSEETKSILRKYRLAQKDPMLGRHHSKETIAKMCVNRKGKMHKEGVVYTHVAVINLETGIFYDSIKEAELSMGNRKGSHLSAMLTGKRKNKTMFAYANN